MPWVSEWVPPALLLEHAGVKVYHVYKDDDFSNGPMRYWCTLNEEGDIETAFDVRELPGWPGDARHQDYFRPEGRFDWPAYDAECRARIASTLRAAIEGGRLPRRAAT